ncbi:sigma-54-dependent transcriptional regulator [Nitrospira sp. Nam74]
MPMSQARSLPKTFTILIVEGNSSDTEILLHAIEQADVRPQDGEIWLEVRATAEGALKAINEQCNEQCIDLVLVDMVLPGMSGLHLVSRIQEIDPDLPVIIISGLASIDTAVEAMKRGAYDYITKPLNVIDFGMRLHHAVRISQILRRHSSPEILSSLDLSTESLVGRSEKFQDLLRQIREAAKVRTTVLITGETGTGKGLVSRAIHEHSREKNQPYQVIDCTTVPEGMVESELFGHVRGAFTGAVSDKPGLFELAHGGTAFLDEVGELPAAMQTKLLRVLEENQVRRVGGTQSKRIDMRFIAATNQDLQEKLRAGGFRADLYYRLAALVIHLPALRDRCDDIPVIAAHLVSKLGREMGKPDRYLDSAALAELTRYTWPGNVRELRNVIERAIILSTKQLITGEEIKQLLLSVRNSDSAPAMPLYADETYTEAKRKVLTHFMQGYLNIKLSLHEGQITKAAADAGIPRQHFALLMKRYLGHHPKP